MESRGGGTLALALGLTLPPGGPEGFAYCSVGGMGRGGCCEEVDGLMVRMIGGFLSIGLLNICGAGLEDGGFGAGVNSWSMSLTLAKLMEAMRWCATCLGRSFEGTRVRAGRGLLSSEDECSDEDEEEDEETRSSSGNSLAGMLELIVLSFERGLLCASSIRVSSIKVSSSMS